MPIAVNIMIIRYHDGLMEQYQCSNPNKCSSTVTDSVALKQHLTPVLFNLTEKYT